MGYRISNFRIRPSWLGSTESPILRSGHNVVDEGLETISGTLKKIAPPKVDAKKFETGVLKKLDAKSI